MKTFLSKKDAEKYLNYLVVNIDKFNHVSMESYHTRKQARKSEAHKYGATIMTRRQYARWRELNKDKFIFSDEL